MVNDLTVSELQQLLESSASAAAGDAAATVNAELASTIGAATSDMSGTVALVGEQWDELQALDATLLNVSVYQFGVLALILGAVVGVGMSLHWRGSRG